VVGEERDILRDVRIATRDGEPEEAIAKAVKELKATRSRTVHLAEWTSVNGVLHFRGKIYVPDLLDLRRRTPDSCSLS
jgi:hypothetical protein